MEGEYLLSSGEGQGVMSLVSTIQTLSLDQRKSLALAQLGSKHAIKCVCANLVADSSSVFLGLDTQKWGQYRDSRRQNRVGEWAEQGWEGREWAGCGWPVWEGGWRWDPAFGLHPNLSLGSPDSAAQSCFADFSCAALSIPVWAPVHYQGEGEYWFYVVALWSRSTACVLYLSEFSCILESSRGSSTVKD